MEPETGLQRQRHQLFLELLCERFGWTLEGSTVCIPDTDIRIDASAMDHHKAETHLIMRAYAQGVREGKEKTLDKLKGAYQDILEGLLRVDSELGEGVR